MNKVIIKVIHRGVNIQAVVQPVVVESKQERANVLVKHARLQHKMI